MRKYELSYIKEEFAKEGYTLLSYNYKNIFCKLEYICPNGHRHTLTFDQWLKGQRCRICSNNKLKLSFAEVKHRLEREGYTLVSTEYVNSGSLLETICPTGHKYIVSINNFTSGYRCGKCSHHVSRAETEVFNFVNQYIPSIQSNRTIIKPYELDIIIPEKKLAIEYCGLYWHSVEAGKDSGYHVKKLNMCNDAGYKLITLFENEWLDKRDIAESVILANLYIFSRRIEEYTINFIDADVFTSFLYHNSLLNFSSTVYIGAYYRGELIAVVGFNPSSLVMTDIAVSLHTDIVNVERRFVQFLTRSFNISSIYITTDRRFPTKFYYIGFKDYSFTSPKLHNLSREDMIYDCGTSTLPLNKV